MRDAVAWYGLLIALPVFAFALCYACAYAPFGHWITIVWKPPDDRL